MKWSRSIVDTDPGCERLAERISKVPVLGFDSESSGPLEWGGGKPMVLVARSNLTGVSFAFSDRTSFYVPVDHRSGNAPLSGYAKVLAALRDTDAIVWVHNLKHELGALARPPLPAVQLREALSTQAIFGGVRQWRCSLVLAWLLGFRNRNGSLGLKQLADEYLFLDMATFQEVTGGKDFDQLPPEAGLSYACEDAEVALVLGEDYLCPLLEQHGDGLRDWYEEVEMPTVWMLRSIEDQGMALSPQRHRDFVSDLDRKRLDLLKRWDDLAPPGVSISSTRQLSALWDKWSLPPGFDPPEDHPHAGVGLWKSEGVPVVKAGRWRVPSTSAEHVQKQLECLEPGSTGYALAKIKLEEAKLAKLVGTYGESLLQIAGQYPDGKLHARLNQTGTRTGRFSSSYPNLQNIPKRDAIGKRIRESFLPSDPGSVFVSADYSQIELRILAHYCGSGSLFDAYCGSRDIHQETADMIASIVGVPFSRAQGKTANFAPIYGSGARRAAATFGTDIDTARAILKAHKKTHPDVYRTLKRAHNTADVRGYIRTLSGRRRNVQVALWRKRMADLRAGGHTYDNSSEYRSCWGFLGAEERKAGNTPIQGSAADVVKVGMLRWWRESGVPIVNQVHDDVIVEAAETDADDVATELKRTLEGARYCEVGGEVRWDLRCPLLVDPVVGKTWGEL